VGRARWHGDSAPANEGLLLVAAPLLRRRATTTRAANDQNTRLHKNLHIPSNKWLRLRTRKLTTPIAVMTRGHAKCAPFPRAIDDGPIGPTNGFGFAKDKISPLSSVVLNPYVTQIFS